MNYLDIILLIPLVWGFIRGLSKGFIIEIASLVALIVGIWAAINFSDFLTSFLGSKFDWNASYIPIISFIIIFVAVVIGIFILAKLIEKFVNLLALGLFNKLAGAVFGALKFAIILSVLFLIINKFDNKSELINQSTKQNSLLYKPITALIPTIIPKLNIIKEEVTYKSLKPEEQNPKPNSKQVNPK